MEEEKAAAYYNELVSKGRNAAMFKQGLGFGSNSTNVPAAKYGMINFVGAGKSAEARKEVEEPLREELEKSLPVFKPTGRHDDDQSRKVLKGLEDGRGGSKRRSEERSRRERRDNKDRSRSRSMEKRDRHRSTSRERRRSSSRERRHSRRDRNGSRPKNVRESRERSKSPMRKRSRRDRSSSKQHSRSQSRDRSQRSRRDRSRDRSQRQHSGRRSRSRSLSKEIGRKKRNHSRSRSRERSRREYKAGRDRSRSRSPGRRTRDWGRDDRKDQSRSDYRQETSRLSPSRRLRRSRSNEERQKGSSRRVERDQDWTKLIPDFDSMTPAEKVKAKMKLQLSQTVVKDTGKGVTDEWERFDFNKDAPLDGDAKQDYFGDDTGASNDMAQLDHLGGSHLFVTEQAKREARLQAAHEAAIFGAPLVVEEEDAKHRSTRRVRQNNKSREDYNEADEDDNDSATAKVSGVVSEQVIALQAGSSWQERIKKMRAAQEQGES